MLNNHEIDFSDVSLSEEDKIPVIEVKNALKPFKNRGGTRSKWTPHKLTKNVTDLLLDLLSSITFQKVKSSLLNGKLRIFPISTAEAAE